MVALATAATVIASQAVITGAYSVTQQAIQLGLLPRLEIRHTSESLVGQIFMPRVNALLLVGVLFLVFMFRSSNALASAYGIAVTGTMVVTTMLAFVVVRKVWNWSPLRPRPLDRAVPGARYDLPRRQRAEGGRRRLDAAAARLGHGDHDVHLASRNRHACCEDEQDSRRRWPSSSRCWSGRRRIARAGTAVFLTGDPEHAPTALLHNLKHNKVLHERNVVLTVEYAETPHVPAAERARIEHHRRELPRVVLRFGFMEVPNIPQALGIARKAGWQFDIMSTSFYLSRRSLKLAARSDMPRWQERLFIALARKCQRRHRIFQDTDEPRRRDRRAGGDLIQHAGALPGGGGEVAAISGPARSRCPQSRSA